MERLVAISAGCPVSLSDKHLTTQLPYNGGSPLVVSERLNSCFTTHLKGHEFLNRIQLCIIQSEIHTKQFFENSTTDLKNYEAWAQRTQKLISTILEATVKDETEPSFSWIRFSAFQCQILLHRPCSRNIMVSENSLILSAQGAMNLINLSLQCVMAGRMVLSFVLANCAFQAGMVLLYSLRNHPKQLSRASLTDAAENSLNQLSKLFVSRARVSSSSHIFALFLCCIHSYTCLGISFQEMASCTRYRPLFRGNNGLASTKSARPSW